MHQARRDPEQLKRLRALLELLSERPMHGYELMKELQESTHGRYTPSPGSIYPTLQMLEDRGFVTVSEADGKKVYQITDAGREFLNQAPAEERGWQGFAHGHEADWADLAALGQELHGMGRLFGAAMQQARRDPEQLKRLRTLLEQLKAGLAEIGGEKA